MHPLTRTARLTGTFYLGLAVTGMLGFLLIRPQVFVAGESGAVLDALASNLPLARLGLLLELGIVVTQVLTALWFFKLFRGVNSFAAGTLATLGLMNATAILGSAAALGTAIQIADSGSADAAVQVSLLVLLANGFWAAGVVFFGAWLIPMGMLVLQSAYAWRWIGWVLIGGGIGYIASIVVGTLAPDATDLASILTIPATVGEFAILLSLLFRGVPSRALASVSETTRT
ncbi:MAG: DUF4386 domain-containing protein [Microcella sp.]|uniref:DUF4386 domain-containing protein n=1 Tax=Microcella sp. TaxID=1913979 RepID=UPI0024CA10C4|nr:DUF4386 domain-containing protein [Microcella sp.]UYN83545.1 MAG: DUF4386 domain-containing protein [Microcella sp.]